MVNVGYATSNVEDVCIEDIINSFINKMEKHNEWILLDEMICELSIDDSGKQY